jgi:N-acetylglucosaminyldiphosphoundecaprenol N-acetyl-beta-D-mannosaminyltransferase
LNIAWRDPAYKATLRACDRVFADGIGLRLGGRMLGVELRDNVNGTDMYPLLCQAAAKAGRSLYLLGARPGVAAAAAAAMRTRFPGLIIAGARDGYFSADEEDAVIEAINRSGAAILLVAMGAPRQEQWIARHRARLLPPIAMGVGGLFDFYSGRIRRAPPWMRKTGLEWVYRLLQEPGRMWRRYLIGNPLFLYRVSRQRAGLDRFQPPSSDPAR